MSQNNLVFAENPFEENVEKRLIVLKKNDTLESIADREGIDLSNYIIYIDGNFVDLSKKHKIKHNTSIVFCKKVSGSDKLKATIAMIGVAAVAYFATPALAGGLQGLTYGFAPMNFATASFITQTGIMLAGGMLVNYLFQYQPDLPKTKESSPSYSWKEGNPQSEGSAVPVLFGKTKIKPPVISANVNTTDGVLTYWGLNDSDAYVTRRYLSAKSGKAETARYNTMTIRTLLADHQITQIHDVFINNTNLKNYVNIFDKYVEYYKNLPEKEPGSDAAAIKTRFNITMIFDSTAKKETWKNLWDIALTKLATVKIGEDDDGRPKYDYRESAFERCFEEYGFTDTIFFSPSENRAFVLLYNPRDYQASDFNKRIFPDEDRIFWLEILDSKFKQQMLALNNKRIAMGLTNFFRFFFAYMPYEFGNPPYIINKVFAEWESMPGYKRLKDCWFKYLTQAFGAGVPDINGVLYFEPYHKVGKTFVSGPGVGVSVIPLDFSPVFRAQTTPSDTVEFESEVLKDSYRSYQALISLGGNSIVTSLESNNRLTISKDDQFYSQFHKADGFCVLAKKDFLDTTPWWDQGDDIDSDYMIGTNNIRLVSNIFDKNIYQQELYPGSRDEGNEQPPEFLYIEPQQEEGVDYAGRRKSVYVSITMPKGLYKLSSSGNKKAHEVKLIFQVKKKTNTTWKTWDIEHITGNIDGSVTFFVGPFNSDYTKKEIYTNFLGGIAPGTNYPTTSVPPADPNKFNISSLPVMTDPIEIRVCFHVKPRLESLYCEQVIVDTVYSYYDFETQAFLETSCLDLKLEASDYSASNLPSIEVIAENSTITITDHETGTSFTKPATSPAWQIVKLWTDREVGLGKPLSGLVLETFEEWHDFCVAEGIESNYVIDYQGSFDEITKPIFALGRANPVKYGNRYGVSIDKRASTYVGVFNEENIVENSFSMEYFPEKEKGNIFSIKFRDKNINYDERTIEYRVPEILIEDERRIEITLNNCTDFQTAKNHAVYLAKNNYYCKKTVQFSTGLETLNNTVGDVISVNFRGISWDFLSTRVESYLGNKKIRVRDDFTFLAGVEYFSFIKDNQTDIVLYSKITNGSDANTPDGFTDIVVEFPNEISVDSVVTIGTREIEKNLYRITSISRDSDRNAKIRALQYDSRVYDKSVFIDDSDEGQYIVLVPRNLTVSEKVVGGRLVLYITWQGSNDDNNIKIYLNGELIGNKIVKTGNSFYYTLPENVSRGDRLLVTAQKRNDKSALYTDQKAEHIIVFYPQIAGELNFDVVQKNNNSFEITTKQSIPYYVSRFEIVITYQDPETKKYEIIKYDKAASNTLICILDKDFISTKYIITVTPVNPFGEKYEPVILEETIDTGEGEKEPVLDLDIDGLTAQWIDSDAVITWNNLVVPDEDKSNIRFNVYIKDSQGTVLRTDYTYSNSYSYTITDNKKDNTIPLATLTFEIHAVNLETQQKSYVPGVVATECPVLQNPTVNTKVLINSLEVSIGQISNSIFSHFETKNTPFETDTAPEETLWNSIAWIKTNELKNIFYLSNTEIEEGKRAIHVRIRAVDIFGRYTGFIETGFLVNVFTQETMEIKDFAVSASNMFTKIPILEGDVWSANSPVAGSVSWTSHNLYYNGKRFEIAGEATAEKYIYFKLPAGVDFSDDTVKTYQTNYFVSTQHPKDAGLLTEHDFIIAVNIAGSYSLAWNAIANEVIGSANIMKAAITDAHIESLSATRITSGLLSDDRLSPNIETVTGSQEKANLAETQAKAYADGIVTAEEQRAIADAQAKANLAEVNAKAYADGIVTAEEQRAIADAQAKADLAETQAKAYADGIVTAEEQRAIADAQAKADAAEQAAKAFAEEKTNNVLDYAQKIGGSFYDGTFEHGLEFWSLQAEGLNVPSAETSDTLQVIKGGINGGNLIKCIGNKRLYSKNFIPIDTSRTYKMKIRIKCETANPEDDISTVNAGFYMYDDEFNYIPKNASYSAAYFCLRLYSLTVDAGWQEFEGTITGIGTSHEQFNDNVSYVKACIVLDHLYPAEIGGPETTLIDSCEIWDVTEVERIQNNLTDLIAQSDARFEAIQSQVDKSITTHFRSGVPTLSNLPASEWTDIETKNIHLGDIYYDNDTGYSYRFRYENSIYDWVRITDSDITTAIQKAQDAENLANEKKRIFVAQPIPPYEVGDLWVQGVTGGIKKCKTTRLTGSYQASDFEDAADITSAEWSKVFGSGKPADNADVTNYDDYRVSNIKLENGVTTIASPLGGSRSISSTNVYGAIKITLPQSWTNTMMKFEVDVYLYNRHRSFKLQIGGYNYAPGEAWVNCFAQLIGSAISNNRVRFGHDGNKCCILIGEITSVWNIPSIVIKNFQAGYSGYNREKWETGWNVQIIDDISGITVTSDIPDSLIDAKSIIGQGALATSNTADWGSQVTGNGKPADNADVTQEVLNLGADISNAKANGFTLIEGGYINTDILQIDHSLIVGQIPKEKLDSSLETITGSQAKANQAQINAISEAQNIVDIRIPEEEAQKAIERNKAHGMPYSKDIVIYGESNKYYPVQIYGGYQNIYRTIKIFRNHYEQAPSDWNTDTHKGSLTLHWQGNFGGWGGAQYKSQIVNLSELYASTLADIFFYSNYIGMVFMLRGGGEGGALYHIASDQPIVGAFGPNPDIAYDSSTLFFSMNGYTMNAPEPVFAKNTERLEAIKIADGAVVAAAEQAAIANAQAKADLAETQAKAYADGIVTAEEQRAIADAQAKANLAEVNAKAYADGIVTDEEQRAIADAQAKADAAEQAAKQYTENWSEQGADVTQEVLNLGADISNAKANGFTLIEGGYINTGIINAEKILVSAKNTGTQLLPMTWVPGTSGSQPFYNQNGSTEENSIIFANNPRGETSPIWQCLCDAVSGPDGGWNTDLVEINHKNVYRFSVFAVKNSTAGSFYLGPRSAVLNMSDNQQNTNPYFYSGQLPEIGKWFLIVGYIYPSDYSGAWSITTTQGGIYDCDTGEKVRNIAQEFKFLPDQTHIGHRAYLYYSTTPGVKLWLWQPRIDLVDGNEPGINELIGKSLGQTIISGGKIKTDFLSADNIRTGTLKSLDEKIELNLNNSAEGLKIKSGGALILEGIGTGGVLDFRDTNGSIMAMKAISTTNSRGDVTKDLSIGPSGGGISGTNYSVSFKDLGDFLISTNYKHVFDNEYYNAELNFHPTHLRLLSQNISQLDKKLEISMLQSGTQFRIDLLCSSGNSRTEIQQNSSNIYMYVTDGIAACSYNFRKEGLYTNGSRGSFSSNGWTKLASGLILQWGKVNTIGTKTINFPIAFPSAALGIVCSLESVIPVYVGAKILSKTQAQISPSTTSATNIYYIVTGY